MSLRNSAKIALLRSLENALGVDLKDGRVAVATQKKNAEVRMDDGSLVATMNKPFDRTYLNVESPGNPGVLVQLVDHNKDSHAPSEAVYQIKAYRVEEESGGVELVGGAVYDFYIGPEGIILSDDQKKRVVKLQGEVRDKD